MGSGGKRKSNDVVRINRPVKRGSGAGGSGGSGGSSGDINNMCPPAFEVGIKPLKPLPDGTPVTVKKDELFARGDLVGKLSPKHLQTIQECVGEGIHYSGRVVNKGKDKAYALFEQRV